MATSDVRSDPDARHRQTKIVCTLGPASSDEETVGRLIAAGMNVARLNLSHGAHEGHAELVGRVRSAAAAQDATVSILVDIQGPKVRIGADGVHARVLRGGRLFERQGLHLVGAALDLPALTEKDRADLAWAAAQDV